MVNPVRDEPGQLCGLVLPRLGKPGNPFHCILAPVFVASPGYRCPQPFRWRLGLFTVAPDISICDTSKLDRAAETGNDVSKVGKVWGRAVHPAYETVDCVLRALHGLLPTLGSNATQNSGQQGLSSGFVPPTRESRPSRGDGIAVPTVPVQQRCLGLRSERTHPVVTADVVRDPLAYDGVPSSHVGVRDRTRRFQIRPPPVHPLGKVEGLPVFLATLDPTAKIT